MRRRKAFHKAHCRSPRTPQSGAAQNQPTREELQRENERLQREIEQLREQIGDRDQQIADLERQLAGWKKDSTNSSQPPSSDGPAVAQRLQAARCRGRRKPGGQKGHPGRYRELEPAERVNQIVPVLPPECRHCGQPLPQQVGSVSTVGEVHRYQVSELPPLGAEIIE